MRQRPLLLAGLQALVQVALLPHRLAPVLVLAQVALRQLRPPLAPQVRRLVLAVELLLVLRLGRQLLASLRGTEPP